MDIGMHQLRLTVLAVALGCSFSVFAEPIRFRIDANSQTMVYRLGEEARFTVSAVNGAGTLVTSGRVDVAVDDYTIRPKRTRTVDLARENPFVMSGTLDEPGFLRFVLSGKDVTRTLRGAGFAPERIRAAGTCPPDFDAFWSAARAKLAKEVPLDPRLVHVPERSTQAYDFWRISFATFGGQRVWGFLTVPKDKSLAPFPARVMISSAGKGRWTWDFECPKDFDRCINMSFTVHAFEPPTNQEDADRLHEKLQADLRAKCGVGSYPAAGLGVSREEGYFYRPILGIDRAVDWLWARPDVDRSRFVYAGGSQGGGLGMMLVGLNHRFTAAKLHVPAMMDVLGSTGGRVDTFPSVGTYYRGRADRDAALRNAAYYNGAFFAPRVTCPMYFSLGFIDEICPPTGVYAAYNALCVKDRRVCHGLLRGHGWWPEAEVTETWLKEPHPTSAAPARVAAVPRERYLDLMEKAVSAYADARIADYIARTEKEWISEHGFARLAANMGILLAHGRIPEKRETFVRLMDICAAQMPTTLVHPQHPHRGAGNDFAVKEIVLCLLEVEKSGLFEKSLSGKWRRAFASFVPEQTYSSQPKVGTGPHNWAVFGAASEQVRTFAGLGGSAAYVERYIADQMRHIDANGMYMDPHCPMVYDGVTRLQFALALFAGYDGPSRAALEEHFLRGIEPTLAMQAATGEIPYGGRSNQQLHNETFYAALCEFYARFLHARGDDATARRFRAAAARAVASLEPWLKREEVHHVKNAYPLETMAGCEKYAYFDKYMVTMASWAYLGYLFADETLPLEGPVPDDSAAAFATADPFHRAMVRAGGYGIEVDTAAQAAYDASGLGRIQRAGAPSFLALSVPFPATYGGAGHHLGYVLPCTNVMPFAVMPGWCRDGEWRYADGDDYVVRRCEVDRKAATGVMELDVLRGNLPKVDWTLDVSARGVVSTLKGDGKLALTIPVFLFDGKTNAKVVYDKASGTVSTTFDGWTCTWKTTGRLVPIHRTYGNRNGLYAGYQAVDDGRLTVRVTIERMPSMPHED